MIQPTGCQFSSFVSLYALKLYSRHGTRACEELTKENTAYVIMFRSLCIYSLNYQPISRGAMKFYNYIFTLYNGTVSVTLVIWRQIVWKNDHSE